MGQEIVVGIAATASGHGYWLFTNKGRVIRFGDADWFGQIFPGLHNGPIVGAAGRRSGTATPWSAPTVPSYAYGVAGSTGRRRSSGFAEPLVGMAVSTTGSGYWLVAADGGVFAYGVAFRGSAVAADAPTIIGAAPFADGYVVVDDQGRVQNFSSAATAPSLPASALVFGITGIAGRLSTRRRHGRSVCDSTSHTWWNGSCTR